MEGRKEKRIVDNSIDPASAQVSADRELSQGAEVAKRLKAAAARAKALGTSLPPL